ncbi:MAG TPA: Fis family transcriptional regulator [Gammaproteobacteria bacterium]|nr:Fis family transcriptional regulator [Gammaproteobacteria bacterium]
MIEENAHVVQTDSGIAWVEAQRESACGACKVRGGCGTSVLASVMGKRRNQVRALDPVGVKPGDNVLIGLRERALVRASFTMYLLPLAGLFVGALMGQQLDSQGEAWTILFGLLGLLAGFGLVNLFYRRIRNNPVYQAVILKRIS